MGFHSKILGLRFQDIHEFQDKWASCGVAIMVMASSDANTRTMLE